MATEVKDIWKTPTSRKFRAHFPGGYVEGAGGLIATIWSKASFQALQSDIITYRRREHHRQRVIGGPSITVKEAYVTKERNNISMCGGVAAGGQRILAKFNNGHKYSLRIGGGLKAFRKFLNTSGSAAEGVQFISIRGTKMTGI